MTPEEEAIAFLDELLTTRPDPTTSTLIAIQAAGTYLDSLDPSHRAHVFQAAARRARRAIRRGVIPVVLSRPRQDRDGWTVDVQVRGYDGGATRDTPRAARAAALDLAARVLVQTEPHRFIHVPGMGSIDDEITRAARPQKRPALYMMKKAALAILEAKRRADAVAAEAGA
jgi:hypothetical protein